MQRGVFRRKHNDACAELERARSAGRGEGVVPNDQVHVRLAVGGDEERRHFFFWSSCGGVCAVQCSSTIDIIIYKKCRVLVYWYIGIYISLSRKLAS